jgi:hypothetical protein
MHVLCFVHQKFMLVKLTSYQDPLNKLYGIRKNDFWDLRAVKRSREVRPYPLGPNIVCLRGGS